MKKRILQLLFGVLFLVMVHQLSAQVTAVDYQIRYDTAMCRWDAYLFVRTGNASQTSPGQRIQLGSQYSIVTDKDHIVQIVQSHNPKFLTGPNAGQPSGWNNTTQINAPTVTPDKYYNSVTPTVTPTTLYDTLTAGRYVKLFSFVLRNVTTNQQVTYVCNQTLVRPFINGSDPNSQAQGMANLDFSNGFALLGSAMTPGTLPTRYPTPPSISLTSGCSNNISVDLATNASTCYEPYTYSWQGPNGYTGTMQDVLINPATSANNGTYSVTVTDKYQCSHTRMIDAFIRPNAGPNQSTCAGSTVNLAGTGPTTGTWSAAANNPSGATLNAGTGGTATVDIDATATGVFNFIYTFNGCPDTMAVTIANIDGGPDPDAVTCFSSGSAMLAAVGNGTWSVDAASPGTATFSNANSATSMVSGFTAPGLYTLNWTVGTCVDQVQIQVNNECECATTGNDILGPASTSFCGTATPRQISGGVAGPAGGSYIWVYSLNNAPFAPAPGSNSQQNYTTPTLSVGNHRFARVYNYTQGVACSDTSSIVTLQVDNQPSTPTSITANPNPVCLGNTVALSVAPETGVTYNWSGPANAGLGTSTSNTNTMTPTAVGSYTVTVTKEAGICVSQPATVTVTVVNTPPTPTQANITSTNPSNCGVSDGTIRISGYNPNTSYNVSYTKNGNPVNATVTSNASGVIIITGLTSGSYSNFIIANAAGCNSGTYTGAITLTDPNPPATPTNLTATPNPACVGQTINLSVTNNTGATYTWSISGAGGGLQTSTTNSNTMIPTLAGTYTVSVTQTVAGCTSAAATTTVTVNPSPTNPTNATVTNTNPTACGATDGTITLSGYMANTAYTLRYSFNGTVTTLTVNSSASGNIVLTNLSQGVYTNFSVENAGGCRSSVFAGPVNLNEPGSPATPTITGSPNPSCLGQQISLSATGAAGASFIWSASAPEAGIGTSTTSSNNMNPSAAGTYTVFVTQTVAGCTSPAGSTTITVGNPPNAISGLMATPNPICLGETVNLSVTATTGETYTWSASPSTGSGLSNPSGASTSMTPTAAGTYTLTVSAMSGACSASTASINVVVNPVPKTPTNADITSTNPTTCSGSDGTISLAGYMPNTAYNVTYSFMGSQVTVSITSNSSGIIVVTGLSAGAYTGIYVTNANGCSSGVFNGTVNLSELGAPPAPGNLLASPNPGCLGETIGLSVNPNPGATFTWTVTGSGAGLNSSTANTTSMTPTAPGVYDVSVFQTLQGCTSPVSTIQVLVREQCANPDFGVTYMDIPLSGRLSTNDGKIAYTYNNVIALSGNPSGCLPTVNTNGTYTFTCATKGEYNYTVDVCRNGQTVRCIKLPLTITVLEPMATNNPPVANHDYVATNANNDVSIASLLNDKCQSLPNCNLTSFSIITPPANGVFSTVTQLYKPNNNYVGKDSFLYEVCQSPSTNPSNCDREWVYIQVFPASSTVFVSGMDDYNQTYINTPLSASVSQGSRANDTDPLNAALTIGSFNRTVAGKGTLNMSADGSYTFTPVQDFVGPVDFAYQVCRSNNSNVCDSATLHLLVDPQAPLGAIGDFVWIDTDGDGIQDASEKGIPFMLISLYNSAGFLVATTMTDINGKYLFEDVFQGQYYIKFEADSKYTATFANVGADNLDSDIDNSNGENTTAIFDVNGGEVNLTIDGGFYECVKIGDNVWYDENKNDIYEVNEPGLNGVKVRLFRNTPSGYVMWEEAITGWKPGTGSDDGYYQFCAPPGQYYIKVVNPGNSLVYVRPFIGTNRFTDSDINNANGPGTSPSFTLRSGESKLDLGAGFYPMATAGNLVWHDVNQNGIQDANEAKAANILVQAYDAQSNEMLGQAFTNANGVYTIDYLGVRDVYLKFDVPNGYFPTVANVGNDNVNSDVDHSFGYNTTRMFRTASGVNNVNMDLGLAQGVLPVEWVSVKARAHDRYNQITWETAAEINVKGYIVERRLNKKSDFVALIDTEIKSKNGAKNVYVFDDYLVEEAGSYVYRIKQVDYDGAYEYSKEVVVERGTEGEVSVYPNPFVHSINIEYGAKAGQKVSLQLYDDLGQIVLNEVRHITRDGSQLDQLNVTNIASGIYTLSITNGSSVTVQKVIKI